MSVAGNESVYRWVPQTHDGRLLESPVIELPRVTTVIGATLAKPELNNWYYDVTIHSLEAMFDVIKDMPKARITEAASNLDEWLEVNALRPTDIRDERADEGSDAHEYLNLLATDGEALVYNVEASPYFGAIKDFWTKKQPEVVASEVTLFSLRHGFAGSCDLVADLGSVPRVVIDLKTRRAGQGAYTSDHLQLAAYRIAWNEMHPDALCSSVSYVLLAFDDGTWSLIPSDIDEGMFLNLLALYKGLKGVRGGKR